MSPGWAARPASARTSALCSGGSSSASAPSLPSATSSLSPGSSPRPPSTRQRAARAPTASSSSTRARTSASRSSASSPRSAAAVAAVVVAREVRARALAGCTRHKAASEARDVAAACSWDEGGTDGPASGAFAASVWRTRVAGSGQPMQRCRGGAASRHCRIRCTIRRAATIVDQRAGAQRRSASAATKPGKRRW